MMARQCKNSCQVLVIERQATVFYGIFSNMAQWFVFTNGAFLFVLYPGQMSIVKMAMKGRQLS